MPRQSRVVVPNFPYHVTHRGNRRQDVFFRDEDREKYKTWLKEYCDRHRLELWAFCLMTNHVHHLVLPHHESSLALTIGQTHGRFAQSQNREYGWTGHLWGNRYFSTPLDEEHMWAAVRYIELNPVRAGLVERAEDYPWSSARAHALGEEEQLLSPTRPFPGGVGMWSAWLAEGISVETTKRLRKNTFSGRPTGSDAFVKKLEAALGRSLLPAKPAGRPKLDRK